MTTSDALKELVDVTSNVEEVAHELEASDIKSNEKRLRQRISSLQTSIMNLKEQLKLEKELWREDLEQIRSLQQQQQEMKCSCAHRVKSKENVKCDILSKTSSVSTMSSGETTSKKKEDILKTHSIKQLLELQNYKRKLAETENMCNLELTRVKQSLEDLKTLQTIATGWGQNSEKIENERKFSKSEGQPIREIFVNMYSKHE
ncbi:uncharacterized protein LOC135126927 [Zophobas morio]|uniref:uncharacterized protein LOC135126927 n=1 Tax=Zophobas morio TaxID=2755281 RepID=UPI0030839E17